MHSKSWAVLLWLTMSVAGVCEAQESPVTPLELTAESVDRFIETFPALAAKLAKIDPEFDVTDADSLVGQISLMIEGDPLDSALDAAAVSEGYETFDDWGAIAGNVLVARLWAENPLDQDEISASEAEIMALTDISEDEKSEMIAGLHEAAGVANERKPINANIALVKARLARLDEMIGTSE